MNWSNFRRALRRRYTEKKVWQSEHTNIDHPGAAALATAKVPLDLEDLMEALADNEAEVEELEAIGGWTVLEQHGWLDGFLEFEWTWAGPPASASQLNLLSFGPEEVQDDEWGGCRDYVLYAADEHPWVVVAALAPRAHRTLVESFFLDFARWNAQPYGIELFNDLPTMTVNRRPDLLSCDTMKAAYFAWLNERSRTNPKAWVGIRDRLLFNHRPARLGQYNRQRPEEVDADLDEADRRLILDNYFGASYFEQTGSVKGDRAGNASK
jgi:hypothetical protein